MYYEIFKYMKWKKTQKLFNLSFFFQLCPYFHPLMGTALIAEVGSVLEIPRST